MISIRTLRMALATLAVPTSMLVAGHAASAHSDIGINYLNDKINIVAGVGQHDHGLVFEGDFGDFANGPYSTKDPGFNTDLSGGEGGGGALGAGHVIGYKVVGPLVYHDGSAFTATTAVLAVEDILTGLFAGVNASTSADDGVQGLIGQASGSGTLHSHLEFAIWGESVHAGLPTPDYGAYGLQLSLFATDLAGNSVGIADSDSFWIVLNHGLDEGVFHDVVHEFMELGHDDDDDHNHSPVPEPATASLLALGAGAVLMRRRR